jgi:hypothetical protein
MHIVQVVRFCQRLFLPNLIGFSFQSYDKITLSLGGVILILYWTIMWFVFIIPYIGYWEKYIIQLVL